MALPIWIPDALRSEQKSITKTYWRCVEAQHVVSTLQLVATLEEQHLLEDILEETKPPVPPECEGLHYLYMTPFRYGLYPNGSRFRKAGRTPGVYYVSEEPRTAIIETAFHLLLGHLEERVFWASIEANFIVGSQVRLHRVTHACPQAYFGMILARISGGIRILNRIRLWAVVAHGKRGGGSCSLGWPW